MNALRHLHSIGVDHSHGLFDDNTTDVNGTDAATMVDTPSIHDVADRSRAISMSILFSVLMAVYIGFCCCYHKQKLRQRIGDSIHQPSGAGASRDRRRSDNQAVLDESSSAAIRARLDAEMARKLEERRGKIRSVLVTRLVVEQDFANDGGHFTVTETDFNADETSNKDTKSMQSLEGDQSITPVVTLSTSEETAGSNHLLQVHSTEVKVTTTNSSSCMDLKKYTDALQSSIANCSNGSHCTNNTNSFIHDATPQSNSPSSILLNHEECNICLSSFEVGDRIAWSRKNKCNSKDKDMSGDASQSVVNDTNCRHMFHAECIERWLLVREGCPVCRRSYFDETNTSVDDNGVLQVQLEVQEVDLETGENADNNTESVESVSSTLALTRVVAIEE
jgi:hypothetical protein